MKSDFESYSKHPEEIEGTKYLYVCGEPAHANCAVKGEVVTLAMNDGSNCPWFKTPRPIPNHPNNPISIYWHELQRIKEPQYEEIEVVRWECDKCGFIHLHNPTGTECKFYGSGDICHGTTYIELKGTRKVPTSGERVSAASAGYERKIEKADKHIQDLRRIYDEWRESKDDGLVTAIFQRAVAAINAATSS